MFKRRSRLTRATFEALRKEGSRRTGPHLSLVVSHAVPGYAAVVPKSVARLSVTRHRVKRHILAALRTLPLPKGLIVFARAGTPQMTYSEIHSELAKLLS